MSGQFFIIKLSLADDTSKTYISYTLPQKQNNIEKSTTLSRGALHIVSGSDIFSQDVSVQLSSALRRLTSVFGMGTGVPTASLPPDSF